MPGKAEFGFLCSDREHLRASAYGVMSVLKEMGFKGVKSVVESSPTVDIKAVYALKTEDSREAEKVARYLYNGKLRWQVYEIRTRNMIRIPLFNIYL